jgi:hypothetical protein
MAMKLSNPGQQMFNVQVESEKLTNNLYLNRAAPSLESIAEGSNLQLAPLPVNIAQRLDSDNEEINRIVSEGGRIYYNLPGGPPQALIVGFVGYQQQNALPNHPCIAWPYWDHHPCAPSSWERTNWTLNSTWPGQAEIVNLYTVLNSASMPTQASITAARWLAYKQAAQALMLAVAAETNSGLVVQTTPYGPVLNPVVRSDRGSPAVRPSGATSTPSPTWCGPRATWRTPRHSAPVPSRDAMCRPARGRPRMR